MNSQIHVPQLTKLNKIFLISCGSIYLLNSVLGLIGDFSIHHYLGLTAAGFLGGHFYQILTYPLVARGLVELIFNGLVIWFIGSDLEVRWGKKTYFTFLLISILGAGAFYLLMTMAFFRDSVLYTFPLISLSGVCYALLIAYGMIFSDRLMTFMLIFPMKAKYFCWLIVGIELYMGIFSAYNKSSWAHLASILSGVAYLKWCSLKAQGKGLSSLFGGLRKHKMKNKLTLVENEKKDNHPKYWQ